MEIKGKKTNLVVGELAFNDDIPQPLHGWATQTMSFLVPTKAALESPPREQGPESLSYGNTAASTGSKLPKDDIFESNT